MAATHDTPQAGYFTHIGAEWEGTTPPTPVTLPIAAAKLTDRRAVDGALFDGSAAVARYGVCRTAGAAAAKAASVPGAAIAKADGKPVEGTVLHVMFAYANTAASPTLTVTDSSGAVFGPHPIRRYGSTSAGTSPRTSWYAGSVVGLVFDGASWLLLGHKNDTTYGAFTGPSASDGTSGTTGLVPAPRVGDQGKFLKGDGTWGDAWADGIGAATADALGGVKIGFQPGDGRTSLPLELDAQHRAYTKVPLTDNLALVGHYSSSRYALHGHGLCAVDTSGTLCPLFVRDGDKWGPNTEARFPVGAKIYYYDGEDIPASAQSAADGLELYTTKLVDVGAEPVNGIDATAPRFRGRDIYLPVDAANAEAVPFPHDFTLAEDACATVTSDMAEGTFYIRIGTVNDDNSLIQIEQDGTLYHYHNAILSIWTTRYRGGLDVSVSQQVIQVDLTRSRAWVTANYSEDMTINSQGLCAVNVEGCLVKLRPGCGALPIGCKLYASSAVHVFELGPGVSEGGFDDKNFHSVYGHLNMLYTDTGYTPDNSRNSRVYVQAGLAVENGVPVGWTVDASGGSFIRDEGGLAEGRFYVLVGFGAQRVGTHDGYSATLEAANPIYYCANIGGSARLIDWATYMAMMHTVN